MLGKYFLGLIGLISYGMIITPRVEAIPFKGTELLISAPSPYAVQVGQQIAERGGNVIDVAVGVSLTLAVTSPYFASMGGGGFALVKLGGQVEAIDFREVAPKATHKSFYAEKAADASANGGAAVGVPGLPAGLWALHKKYGRLKWASLFEGPLELASQGFRVSGEWNEYTIAENKRFDKGGRKYFLKGQQSVPKPGELLVQKALAKALRAYRDHNLQGFYAGAVAKDIVASVNASGGVMTLDDLSHYKVRWLKPMVMNFRDHTIYLMPPPSSGGVVIQTALELVQRLPFDKYEKFSVEEFHLLGQVLARAFKSRLALGDPDFHKNPLEKLFAKDYLDRLAKSINVAKATEVEFDWSSIEDGANDDSKLQYDSKAQPESKAQFEIKTQSESKARFESKAQSESKTRSPTNQSGFYLQSKFESIPPSGPKTQSEFKESSETTHFVVMDKNGNAVSLTETLNGNYGSGVVSGEFGIALNNEMDDFTTRPSEPNQFGLVQGPGNAVEPGKRPLSSMSPTIVEKQGETVLALGAPGGPRIISGVFQVLYRTLTSSLDIDQAIQAPRVHHQYLPNTLYLDKERFAPETVKALKDRGHAIDYLPGISKVYGIKRSAEGILEAGFDSRGEGGVGGY